MMTERRLGEELIECHDGWDLLLYWVRGCEHDRHGIRGVELTRGTDNSIHVPSEDIPDVIAALQRMLDAETDQNDAGPPRQALTSEVSTTTHPSCASADKVRHAGDLPGTLWPMEREGGKGG